MNCCFRHFFGPKIFPIAFKSFMSHAREKQTLTETHVCGLDCLNWFNFVHIFFCRTVHFFLGPNTPLAPDELFVALTLADFISVLLLIHVRFSLQMKGNKFE